jgi:hypothetical protein
VSTAAAVGLPAPAASCAACPGRVMLALLPETECEGQRALSVASAERLAVGAHGSGKVAEVVSACPRLSHASVSPPASARFVGGDGLDGVAKVGEGVAEIELRHRGAEARGAAEAAFGVGQPPGVRQVTAEVDQLSMSSLVLTCAGASPGRRPRSHDAGRADRTVHAIGGRARRLPGPAIAGPGPHSALSCRRCR